MSVLTNNNVSVEELNQTNKYKELEIEIEKKCHLKTTTMSVIVGALDMIKKLLDKCINKKISSSPNRYEIHALC